MDEQIVIKKSPTADTRTCDYASVTKETLIASTKSHIEDVARGLFFISKYLLLRAGEHDWTKLEYIDMFYADFVTGFETTDWWEMHKQQERHHLETPEGVRDSVTLLDVIECLIDGVMAGLSRTGEYKHIPLPDHVLQAAYRNTAEMLVNNIRVEE